MNSKFETLYNQLPEILNSIQGNESPEWGSMHLIQMLKHVTTGFETSLSYQEFEIVTPEEKVAAFQRFLMSDKPLVRNAKIPHSYHKISEPDHLELKEVKERFLDQLRLLKKEMDENAEYWSVHPDFGRLDADQTAQLHYKHIRHHFIQFGIIKE
jgi:oxepin-CoA hydrolase/3-oxo-5,6-dehydrosuberyl-CoA semialdehyde dehydrogenase